MNKYSHLLEPIQVGNILLKNRLTSTNSMPHFLQGPEPYPSDAMIKHFADRAKNGAALITLTGIHSNYGLPEMPPPPGMPPSGGDVPRFPRFDIYNPKCQNYFTMLVDAVHFYGSKVAMSLQRPLLPGYDVCADEKRNIKAFDEKIINEMIDAYVEQAEVCKLCGIDAVSVHMAYGSPFAAHFLSPKFNKRTDEYGGSIENRSRVALEICRRIKKSLGQNFPVEILISPEDDGGLTVEDTCEFLKLGEGLFDIVQVRMPTANDAHPTGFMNEKTPALKYAERFKALNLKNMLIAPVGGFQNLDDANNAIAEGKADLIAAARAWICDFEYGEKIMEGRGEDVVPCIRCNKCHVISEYSPFVTGCSVNPEFGLEHVLKREIDPADKCKKVAVIGGGVAGMEAALVAKKRGHFVTVYEKEDVLGGQLIEASVPNFKWPIKDFKDYLIKQIKKENINVKTGTMATPELISKEKYHAVIVAIGAEPVVPPIKGADNKNVVTALWAFDNGEKINGEVVIVGGGDIGVEAGIYFADKGHNVTVLEMTDMLAKESNRPHYYEVLEDRLKDTERLTTITKARVKEILEDKVIYTDDEGKDKKIKADTVIIAAGSKSKSKEAISFYDCAQEYHIIGDCEKVGSIMQAMRSGYAAASQV